MKKNFYFFTSLPGKLLPFIMLLVIASCNNKGKKDEPKGNKDSAGSKDQPGGTQSVNAITFKQYRLDTTTIRNYEKNPQNAKLFIFKPRFDDLKNPTAITLWAYPAKNHKDFGEGTTPFELLPEGNPAFIDTKDIYVGDNEINLKYLHVDNNQNKPFHPFAYLLLTPAKGAKGNLVFTITPNVALAPMADFPTETNPIPPGKPEEN